MLPLQITLEGFLSYRDAATISFEGASLWMLAGRNGAGKSSVFDAMRWTLFGAHRGGKSGHEALIHRRKDRLRVAFDLALGENRFRLIRTLARAGRSTWQIEQILDGQTTKVPETDGRDGFEKWVRENIGLSDETFCTAMYLAQNRGDAILGATPLQRYEMLAEIVDISAYAALHERAKIAAADLESAAKAAERSWQLAPGADAETIAELGEQLQRLGALIERNGARREQILGLEALAAQWQKWDLERQKTNQILENARVLLADASQIERDFARLGELETLLPALERYVEARARNAQNRREIASRTANLQVARALAEQLDAKFSALQIELSALESARRDAENARLAAISEKAELAPKVARARQIAQFRADIAGLKLEIQAFPADLSEQKNASQVRLSRARDELAARAIWSRFEREKSAYREARARQKAAQIEAEARQDALPDARNRAQRNLAQLDNAREIQTRAVEQFSAATARRDDAKSALARLADLKNQADCFFCGQKLTPEHLQKERIRLENGLENAEIEANSAQVAREFAEQGAQNAQTESDSTKNEVRALEIALQTAFQAIENARNVAASAASRAEAVFAELRPEWQARFENAASGAEISGFCDSIPQKMTGLEVETARVTRLLNGDFPAPVGEETSQQSAELLENWRLELEVLTARDAEKIGVDLRLRDRENQLAALATKNQDEDLSGLLDVLLARENALEDALAAALQTLESGQKALQKAGETAFALKNELDSARDASAQLHRELAGLAAAQVEIERALASAEFAAPGSYRERDESDLRAEFESLQSEKAALSSGDLSARLGLLHAAQNRVAELEFELAQLEKALENVPPEARCAPQELQRQAQELAAALKSDVEEQKLGQFERNRLEERRAEKARLEQVHGELQGRARAHKTLAELLGPHQLQRYLLREAENGIIDEANAVLDRVSSGELRLELRADEEEIAGARRGMPKVLDLVVLGGNEAGSLRGERGSGLLPAFLSGSQRFRVAVALALGTGRYAMRGGGSRLEAVIIDEGFGALDKIGRGEMIEELQLLGEELRRVILVSHQEEFFEAFPNRYLIENDGDTSTARLMTG